MSSHPRWGTNLNTCSINVEYNLLDYCNCVASLVSTCHSMSGTNLCVCINVLSFSVGSRATHNQACTDKPNLLLSCFQGQWRSVRPYLWFGSLSFGRSKNMPDRLGLGPWSQILSIVILFRRVKLPRFRDWRLLILFMLLSRHLERHRRPPATGLLPQISVNSVPIPDKIRPDLRYAKCRRCIATSCDRVLL